MKTQNEISINLTCNEIYIFRLQAFEAYQTAKADYEIYKTRDNAKKDLLKFFADAKEAYANIIIKCNKALKGIYTEINL